MVEIKERPQRIEPKNKPDPKTIKEEFEEVRRLLQNKPNGFNDSYIYKQLHEKENLRRVFLATVRHSPAKISEISEESLLTKPTCYSQLFKLLDLHLINRIYVMDVMSGEITNEIIKTKYKEWVKTMPGQLKRYYLAKTSFWVITDLGISFAKTAYNYDQEFREKQTKREGTKK